MNKVLTALAMLLSLSLFGAGAVSALDSSPTTVAQDGDKGKKKKQDGKKKHGKKKHKKGKGKKQGGKKGGGKKKNNRRKNGKK